MRRERKESATVSATPPLTAIDENPMMQHPGLAPLMPGFKERVRARLSSGAVVTYDMEGATEEEAVARAEQELPDAVDIQPAESVTEGA